MLVFNCWAVSLLRCTWRPASSAVTETTRWARGISESFSHFRNSFGAQSPYVELIWNLVITYELCEDRYQCSTYSGSLRLQSRKEDCVHCRWGQREKNNKRELDRKGKNRTHWYKTEICSVERKIEEKRVLLHLKGELDACWVRASSAVCGWKMTKYENEWSIWGRED